MKVSVIIASHPSRRAYLIETLASLRNQKVDDERNWSTRISIKYAGGTPMFSNKHSGVGDTKAVFHLDENLIYGNPSAQLNQAVKVSGNPDIILRIDDDIVFKDPHQLQLLVNSVSGDGVWYGSLGKIEINNQDRIIDGKVQDENTPGMSFCAFTRETFEKVGGFNEDFVFLYGESEYFLLMTEELSMPVEHSDAEGFHLKHAKPKNWAFQRSQSNRLMAKLKEKLLAGMTFTSIQARKLEKQKEAERRNAEAAAKRREEARKKAKEEADRKAMEEELANDPGEVESDEDVQVNAGKSATHSKSGRKIAKKKSKEKATA